MALKVLALPFTDHSAENFSVAVNVDWIGV